MLALTAIRQTIISIRSNPSFNKFQFVYFPGLRGGPVNTRLEFLVDTREAGYGGLGLSVEGPSKVEINCVDNEVILCSFQ